MGAIGTHDLRLWKLNMRPLRLLSMSAAVALPLVWLALFRPTFLGGPMGYVIVAGESMEPTLYTGDLVLTLKKSEYQVGETVAFKVDGAVVIHRIIGGDAQNGYILQGDNKAFPDDWHPTSSEIVGRQWVAIPGAGKWFHRAGQPLPLGTFLGILTAAAFAGEKTVRRRQAGRWKKMQNKKGTPRLEQQDPRLVAAFASLLVVAAAALLVAFAALREQPNQTRLVEQLRYDHVAAFDYRASVEPSSLYPAGQVQPADLERAGEEGAEAQVSPIFSTQPPVFTLDFEYGFQAGEVAAELNGVLTPALVVRAGDAGWEKSLPVDGPSPFQGEAVSRTVTLDLSAARDLIAQVEEETGFQAHEYLVELVMGVEIAGTVDGHAIEETFSDTFTITLREGQARPDAVGEHSESHAITAPVTGANKIGFFGVSVPVMPVRLVSLTVFSFAGFGAAALAGVLFLGIGRAESARIRARYGSMLVTVVEPELPESCQEIRLASIADLMKLAEKDGRMVLHERRADGSDLYFVQDGSVLYTHHVAPQSAPRAQAVEEAK